MSTMRAIEQLDPLCVFDINEQKDCGPWMATRVQEAKVYQGSGQWTPGHRYWLCDYHEGFQDGCVAMRAQFPQPKADNLPVSPDKKPGFWRPTTLRKGRGA